MAEPAPFRADLARLPGDGPEAEARAFWLRSRDGVRLRAGLWGEAGPLVVMLPGRCEALEKCGPLAAALVREGMRVLALDWRGQGLSGRLGRDAMQGHVHRFTDYQLDLLALLDFARAEGLLAGGFGLHCHSMGGLIGLRALRAPGFGARAVVFSAPMWGIRMKLKRRPMAAVLSRVTRDLGVDRRYAPGTGPVPQLLAQDFTQNTLTRDREAFAHMVAQLEAMPELALGGPSIGWVRRAVAEARLQMRLAPPDLPALMVLGSAEAVVLQAPVRAYAARWPGAALHQIEGALHEPLSEPALRAVWAPRIARHLTGG